MSAPDGPVGTDRSLGQLVSSATAEMSALVHDEIALAKAEMRQDVKRGAVGGGAFGAAGAVLLFSLPMLSFAAAYGIHNLGLGLAWSFLRGRLRSPVLALICWRSSRRKFKKVKPPEKAARLGQADGCRTAERQAAPASRRTPWVAGAGSRSRSATRPSVAVTRRSAVARSSS